MNMNTIIKIIESIVPGAKVDENTNLLEHHIIDSFAIINLVANIEDEYGVAVSARDIVPENFETPAAILAMIERLEDED